jgi:hypothetical protein
MRDSAQSKQRQPVRMIQGRPFSTTWRPDAPFRAASCLVAIVAVRKQFCVQSSRTPCKSGILFCEFWSIHFGCDYRL